MSAILDMKAPLSAGPFLRISNNLSDVADAATARTNLGLVAGGAGDIWVEKAGDVMTGQLLIDLGSDIEGLIIQGDAAQSVNLQEWQDSAGNILTQIKWDGTYLLDYQKEIRSLNSVTNEVTLLGLGDAGFGLNSGSPNTGRMFYSNVNGWEVGTAAGGLAVKTSGTDFFQMFINSTQIFVTRGDSFFVGIGEMGAAGLTPAVKLHVVDEDAVTNVVTDVIIAEHNSSNTPLTNFAVGLKFRLKSSTTDGQDAAKISALWTNATHATRTSALVFETVDAGGALAEQARVTATGFQTQGERVVSTETHTATGTMADTKERAVGNRATAFTLTLPAHKSDKEIRVINIGAGAMTLIPTSGTVQGAASQVLNQRESLILLSDNTNWN